MFAGGIYWYLTVSMEECIVAWTEESETRVWIPFKFNTFTYVLMSLGMKPSFLPSAMGGNWSREVKF